MSLLYHYLNTFHALPPQFYTSLTAACMIWGTVSPCKSWDPIHFIPLYWIMSHSVLAWGKWFSSQAKHKAVDQTFRGWKYNYRLLKFVAEKYIVACHLPRAPSYGGVMTWVEGSQTCGDCALARASNLLGYQEYTQQDFSSNTWK